MIMVDTRHKIRYQKPCSTCGKVFGAWNNNQRYCSENCRQKGKITIQEEYRRKKAEKAEKEEKNRTKTLAEKDAEAKAFDTTYGKRVAATEYQVKIERKW